MAAGLANAQTAINSLTLQLEGFNGGQTDLNTISSTLADIAADVKELLNNGTVVNADIIITNPAQLLLAESLVGTDTEAPNVIVNGAVSVSFTETNFDADQRSRTQAVVNKIATVVGNDLTVTNTYSPTTVIEFPSLTFVDGQVSVTGAPASFPTLLTVSGNFIAHYGGAIEFPVLASVGGDFEIDPSASSITSLNLNGVSISGDFIGDSPGVVSLDKATVVNFGGASVVSATLDMATDIDLGHADDLASLYLSAPKAATIDIAADEVTGDLQILNTNSATIINIPNLAIAGPTTIGKSSQLNLNKLIGFNGVSTIESTNVNIPELTTNASGTMTFTEATTLNFPKLTLGSAFDGQKAESITFKSGRHTDLSTTDKAKSLTILELDYDAVDFETSGLSVLETFTVTGKVNSDPTMAASVTSGVYASGPALKTVIMDGMLDILSVGGPELITLSTSGNIRVFSIDTAEKLTTPSIGHDHIDGSGAAELHISNNDELTTVDFSSITDVGVLVIVDNAKLASFAPPSKETRVESVATVAVTVTGNALEGVYTPGTAVVSATDTTPEIPAMEASIVQSSIYALRLWIEAHAETDSNTPTFNIEIDALDSDGDGDADDGDYATVAAADANNNADDGNNQIDTLAELKTVKEE